MKHMDSFKNVKQKMMMWCTVKKKTKIIHKKKSSFPRGARAIAKNKRTKKRKTIAMKSQQIENKLIGFNRMRKKKHKT